MMCGNIKLTSSELSQVWVTYITNSMAKCMLKYFQKTTEDTDIHTLVQSGLQFSEEMELRVKQLFLLEKLPIPYGFTNEDVNLEAPKLFTDRFIIEYIKQMMAIGITTYGISLAVCPRDDVRKTFKYAIEQTTNQLDNIIDVLLKKGIYIRPPYIPYPKKAEYVHKVSFFNALFGDRRVLSSIEITNIFFSMLTNSLGKALITGFLQVSKNQSVKEFL